MRSIFTSCKFHTACWALDHNFCAFSFNMIEKLSSSHVLEFFLIADVTAKFRTLIHSMFLKLYQSFPNNSSILSVFKIALVWEFTKIDAIFENFVDILQKLSSLLTIWAANIVSWSSFCGQIFNVTRCIIVLQSRISYLSSKCINICKIIFIVRWPS